MPATHIPGPVRTRTGIVIGGAYIKRHRHVDRDGAEIQSLLLRKPGSLKRRLIAARDQALWVTAVLVASVAVWRL